MDTQNADLGDLVATRKMGLGAVLGFAAFGLPALGLIGLLLASVMEDGLHEDQIKGLGFAIVFALGGCGGAVIGFWSRVDIYERGFRARGLTGTVLLPFSNITTISVRRSSTHSSLNKDLRTGEGDLNTELTVADENGKSVSLSEAGFGVDVQMEKLIDTIVDSVSARMSAQLDKGLVTTWIPGLVVDATQVSGLPSKSVFDKSLTELASPSPLALPLDDDSVALDVELGHVTVRREGTVLTTFPCAAQNFFPGARLLAERSAWEINL